MVRSYFARQDPCVPGKWQNRQRRQSCPGEVVPCHPLTRCLRDGAGSRRPASLRLNRTSSGYCESMTRGAEFQVGQRVRLTDTTRATGEIVDDYGSLAGVEVQLDRAQSVRGRRWAVSTADGRLSFVDDDDIEPIGG
jgi:hypothetical protein